MAATVTLWLAAYRNETACTNTTDLAAAVFTNGVNAVSRGGYVARGGTGVLALSWCMHL